MIPSRFPAGLRSLLLVPLIAVGLAACGGAQEAVSERIVEEVAGEGVDLELGDDGQIASIETEDGSLEMNAGAEVPEEWPDDVPLFDDGVLGSSLVSTSDGQTFISIDYSTDRGAADVVDGLIAVYESAGFTTTATSNMGEGSESVSIYAGERDGTTVSVSAASATDSPTVVILGLGFPAAG